MDAGPARMIDLAFALEGAALPREHRGLLAAALEAALPWLGDLPGVGVHRLNVSAGGGPQALLSGRTRLTLRVPRESADDAAALAGRELTLGASRLRVGAARVRELLPYSALYAHLVVADADDGDEAAFVDAIAAELKALDVACRAICGRHQITEGGAIQGFSLMLDGLNAAHSLRVLEAGLGPHRRLGCGLFVPHKSSVAVGTPA
ncbi:MAG: type I-MYXAN CRISPR-associated protein Cas6/Cmx6 [Rubrivivax sp.]|nr:type I-MYXAN CRISPR-associated protein Cas6/Cmx6 [Rubrivivax sp.]